MLSVRYVASSLELVESGLHSVARDMQKGSDKGLGDDLSSWPRPSLEMVIDRLRNIQTLLANTVEEINDSPFRR